METYISMLRGINVGGRKKVRMADLRELYESLGFANVTTYLQSGNVVFAHAEADEAVLAKAIEEGISRFFGYAVTVLVRDAAYFRRVIRGNPFLNGRSEDPSKLHVTFLASAPASTVLNGLVAPSGESGEFRQGERAIYLICPDGYGRTKLSNTFFERKLGVAATTRNWKSVASLYELASR